MQRRGEKNYIEMITRAFSSSPSAVAYYIYLGTYKILPIYMRVCVCFVHVLSASAHSPSYNIFPHTIIIHM